MSAPDATVTVAGIESAVVPPDKLTDTPVLGAAFESVTVQVVVLPLITVAGLQDKLAGCGGPDSNDIENDFEIPFAVAVITATWSDVTAFAVTEKVAAAEPAGTVTSVGKLRFVFVLDSVTPNPPVGAALLKVIVHVRTPAPVRVAGEQLRPDKPAPVTVGTAMGTAIVPLVAVAPTAAPFASEAVTLENWSAVEEATLPDENVTVACAKTPAEMIDSFIPYNTHVTLPWPLEQETLLLAAVAAAPARKERAEISLVE